MKRSKKIILVSVMAIVVLAGTIGGVAIAQTEDEDNSQPEAKSGALLEKVCEIYNAENPEAPIDCQALKDAFTKARDEIQTQARDKIRQKLIDEDIVTEEQLEEFEAWMESRPEFPTDEFKAWMESRPEFPTEEFKEWMESRPDFRTDEFKEWMESRPDFSTDEFKAWMESIPDDIPFRLGPRSHDGRHGFGGFGGGLRGWLTPDDTSTE